MEMTSDLLSKNGIRKIVHHSRSESIVLLVDKVFADRLRDREGQQFSLIAMPISFRIDQIIDIDDSQSMILGGDFRMDGYCKSIELPGFHKGNDSSTFTFKFGAT